MVSAWLGGLSGLGDVCLVWGGGLASQHALRQTPPPCGQTHTCKNITLATTSLRLVIMEIILYLIRFFGKLRKPLPLSMGILKLVTALM